MGAAALGLLLVEPLGRIAFGDGSPVVAAHRGQARFVAAFVGVQVVVVFSATRVAGMAATGVPAAVLLIPGLIVGAALGGFLGLSKRLRPDRTWFGPRRNRSASRPRAPVEWGQRSVAASGVRNPERVTTATIPSVATTVTASATVGWERAATTPTAEATTCAPIPTRVDRPTVSPRSTSWSYTWLRSPCRSGRRARSRRRMATAVSVTGTATSSGTAHHTDHRVDGVVGERRQQRAHRSEEVRARVPEVDTRRGPVEEQEAGEGGRERETDGRGRTAEDGEADRDDRDRARSEPVLAVEQVHRVQQAEDEDHGRDPFERRAVDADRGDDRDRDLRADAEGDRQGPDVVGETERQRERAGHEDPRVAGHDGADRGREEHGHATEVRDRDPLGLEVTGAVDDPPPERHPDRERGDERGDDERDADD